MEVSFAIRTQKQIVIRYKLWNNFSNFLATESCRVKSYVFRMVCVPVFCTWTTYFRDALVTTPRVPPHPARWPTWVGRWLLASIVENYNTLINLISPVQSYSSKHNSLLLILIIIIIIIIIIKMLLLLLLLILLLLLSLILLILILLLLMLILQMFRLMIILESQ